MLKLGTYVSGEEAERNLARELGYRCVCQHPNEVGLPSRDELFTIDADNVLFGDKQQLIHKALQAAQAGANVGVHTFYPHDPQLAVLLSEPTVAWARTHLELFEDPPSASAGAIKLAA